MKRSLRNKYLIILQGLLLVWVLATNVDEWLNIVSAISIAIVWGFGVWTAYISGKIHVYSENHESMNKMIADYDLMRYRFNTIHNVEQTWNFDPDEVLERYERELRDEQ